MPAVVSEVEAYGAVADLTFPLSTPDIQVPPEILAGPDGVSLIIPAWNEEDRLPATLEKYVGLLENYGTEFEVVVVLDGVTDRTAEVAARYAERHVRVLEFGERLGKGGAILEGMRSARFDFVGFIDADAPITAVNLAAILSELAEHDVAIASRWTRRSVARGRRSLSRAIFSKSWNLLTRTLLGLELSDTQCGAKFFRAVALDQILNQVVLTNWAFDASLLFHLKRAGYSLKEVPVDWTDDPATKMRLERAVPAMFLSILGIRLMSLPRLSGLMRPWAGRLYRHFG